jgi:copper chaperone CopZ
MATCAVCELHAESTFKVEGMDCREEVALIERRFKTLTGVEAFSADVMSQRLHVKYDAAKLSAATIAGAACVRGSSTRSRSRPTKPAHAGGRRS